MFLLWQIESSLIGFTDLVPRQRYIQHMIKVQKYPLIETNVVHKQFNYPSDDDYSSIVPVNVLLIKKHFQSMNAMGFDLWSNQRSIQPRLAGQWQVRSKWDPLMLMAAETPWLHELFAPE